jgi:putative monooxygenase ydhR
MQFDGPVIEEFLASTKQLAESIADEPGVISEIWNVEEGMTHYGSTYLFKNREYLEVYR